MHFDLSATLFGHDTAVLGAEPAGKTLRGSWSLVTAPRNEADLTAVIGTDEESWSSWEKQFSCVWRFSASENTGKADRCPVYYFIRDRDGSWSMVNPEEPDTVGAFIALTEDRTYEKVNEENCPKPQGRYKTSVLLDGKWTEAVYLDVRADGSVLLYYSDGKTASGTEMTGRWTLWTNLEQEGTFGATLEGDAWQKWNRETAYVWRFDSSGTYPVGGGFRDTVWMLFSFKTDGSLWLHHQLRQFSQVWQLRPAE